VCCTANEGCKIKNSKIETAPLKIEAALGAKSPEDKLVLKPVTGTQFAEYQFEGALCVEGSNKNKIRGHMTLTWPKGREEATEQALGINIPFSSEELEWVNLPAMGVVGNINLKLASGKAWSFH
jgi:hypothetical protein